MNCRHEWKPVQIDQDSCIPGLYVCVHCGADKPKENK